MTALMLAIFVLMAQPQSSPPPRADWLPLNQPSAIDFHNNRGVVDLYLIPDQPVRLLVSNVDLNEGAAVLNASVALLYDSPKYRPAAIQPEVGPIPGKLKVESQPSFVANLESMASARDDSVTQTTERSPQNTRDFWLHVGDTPLENRQGYQMVKGRLAECTHSVEVYVDRSLLDAKTATSALDLKVTELVHRLQAEVVPAIANHIGPIPDPDGNGRLTVLLTPWLGRLRGGAVSVRGFVRSSDFRQDLPAPFSNHADLLYLNSDLPTGPALTTLLLHEVAHAALTRQSTSTRGNSATDWDDWLNEGLAHQAERRCGGDWSNIGYRIARYWESPATSPLIVRDYYRSGRWRDHGCRGATYLFLDWCERQATRQGVSRFTPELVKTNRSGPDAIEAVCHTRFADLYRAWTISMANTFTESAEQESADIVAKKCLRFDHWDVTHNPQQSFTIWNTATQFQELHASRAGWYRLTFHAPQTTAWQCTVIQTTPSATMPSQPPVSVQTAQRAVGVASGL